MSSASEGTVRSASVPQLPQSLLPRFRSSVEDLNQEIERLVLQPHSYHGSEEEEEEVNQLINLFIYLLNFYPLPPPRGRHASCQEMSYSKRE